MKKIENEMGYGVGGGYTPFDQIVSPVGPQFTIPFTSVDSKGQPVEGEEHIHLYGQSQFHHNLGPVYAVPTYPWTHGNNPHAGNPPPQQESYQHTGSGQWQQEGIHPPAMFIPFYCCGWQPMKCNYCH